MKNLPQKYHLSIITLHWIMALAFILMLLSGFVMTNLNIDQSLKFQMFQWHKSLGVILLCAFFLRISTRLLTKVPQLPQKMKNIEKIAAKIGHYSLYFFMIFAPFSGWVLVSSSPYGLPTIVFGWFEFPHLSLALVIGNDFAHEIAEELHWILAYSFFTVILLHIAAVVKHRIFDKENLLPRMGIGRIK